MEEESGPAGWIAAALPVDAVLVADVERPTVVWLDRRKLTRHQCDRLSIAAEPIAGHLPNDTTDVGPPRHGALRPLMVAFGPTQLLFAVDPGEFMSTRPARSNPSSDWIERNTLSVLPTCIFQIGQLSRHLCTVRKQCEGPKALRTFCSELWTGMLTGTQLINLRVDQNGSLVAPPALQQAFEQHARGAASDAQLRQAQDRSIRDVIRRQEAVGLPVVTDGEFRRRNFQESFSNAVSGFDVPQQVERLTDWREPNNPLHRTEQNFDAAGPAIATRRGVVARLQLKQNVVLDEYRYSAGVATRPVKVSLIGPDRIAQRFAWERSQAVYQDTDAFVADVVAIQRQMISELVAAGCRYVHMDAPGFTAYVDKVSLDRMRARGEDPQKSLARGIKAENDVIAGFDGVTFGLHICRGNPRGVDPATGKIMPQWHREGHYDSIAEQLFSGLNHHRLLLEYDSERAGDFTPLRYVPKGRIAVLGLVTTKSAELESIDALRRRIDDAARYLPLDQLALSPQCGFSSGVGGAQLPEDVQWRKFERIVETARAVWGSV